MALSRVRWLAGSRPVSWPSPVAAPGAWSARTGAAGAALAAASRGLRRARLHTDGVCDRRDYLP